mgnify:CR=1 FL=1
MKNLRSIRFRRNLTIRELADLVGVHYSLISYWENGKKNPRPHNVKKLCEVLEVSEEDLREELL